MGQPVGLVARRMLRSRIIRYEIDRSLTGTGHESYVHPPDVDCSRPPDLLAARLFATNLVQAVHIYSNVITVTLSSINFDIDAGDTAALDHAVEGLFIHYLPGVSPVVVQSQSSANA